MKRCIPSFRPSSPISLVNGLSGINALSIREGLREDAAEGFLRWCRPSPSSASVTDPDVDPYSRSFRFPVSRSRKQYSKSSSRGRRATVCPPETPSKESLHVKEAGGAYPNGCGLTAGHYDPLNFKTFLHLGLSICIGLLNSRLRLPAIWNSRKPGQTVTQANKELDFTIGLGIGVGLGIGLGVAMSMAAE
jgi:hypothetical protein